MLRRRVSRCREAANENELNGGARAGGCVGSSSSTPQSPAEWRVSTASTPGSRHFIRRQAAISLSLAFVRAFRYTCSVKTIIDDDFNVPMVYS